MTYNATDAKRKAVDVSREEFALLDTREKNYLRAANICTRGQLLAAHFELHGKLTKIKGVGTKSNAKLESFLVKYYGDDLNYAGAGAWKMLYGHKLQPNVRAFELLDALARLEGAFEVRGEEVVYAIGNDAFSVLTLQRSSPKEMPAPRYDKVFEEGVKGLV